MKSNFQKYIKDIRFWIILSMAIRLIGITDPPIEIGHNWRQTTVTMVARNFLEEDNNILYPRIDIAGEKTGITGMEFPAFNYVIYLVSKIFGYGHWYGRLINLLISGFGAWYFYLLIKRYFSAKIAFYATLILIFSVWWSYARKIMPDTFSVSLMISGIYFVSNYLENNSKKAILNLIVGSILICFGVLSKLPSGVLLAVISIFLFVNHYSISKKITLSLALGLTLIPSVFWYFYWVPYLNETYEFTHFFMGKSIGQGFSETMALLPKVLEKFYGTSLYYSGFIIMLLGIFFSFKRKNKLMISVFFLCFITFGVIILKSGETFAYHTYYILPFLPVMALMAGYGLSSLKQNWVPIALVIIICGEGFLNQFQDLRIPENKIAQLTLEKDLDKVSNSSDLILINSGDYPTPMYLAHRKGWVSFNEKIQNREFIISLKSRGLKHIVILKRSFGTDIKLNYELECENEDYSIYSVE